MTRILKVYLTELFLWVLVRCLSSLVELEQMKTAGACLQMALQSRNKRLQSICGNRIYTQLF